MLDRRRSLSPAGGVPHQAHEGPALVLGEVREESNQISDVGGHPNWSGMWSGIFLDCGISRGFCKTSTPRGGTLRPAKTAVSLAIAGDTAGSFFVWHRGDRYFLVPPPWLLPG